MAKGGMLAMPEPFVADSPAGDATFGLTDRALIALRSVLSAEPRVRQVLVFGSRARGSHRRASDIDLALDAPGLDARGLSRLAEAIDDLLLPQEVDLVVLDRVTDPELLARIRADGRLLFDPDSSVP